MKGKMTVKRFIACILVFVMFFEITGLDGIGIASEVKAETGSGKLQFSGYKMLGDTIEVVNAPEGSTYKWKVTNLMTGKVSMTGNTTGKFVTSDKHDECMITCTVGEEELSMYCSALPVMYIDSEDAYYEVEKENYSDATIKLTGNEFCTDEDLLYEGAAEIKLRGNSTAYRPKRPFRIKLDKKANLLGLGTDDNGESYKSKHWVLLANDIDHSLIRNKLLYDFSGAIGTEFYFHSTNVALVYNGEYVGTYLLCEHRRVDEGRIDITDWVSIGEDAAAEIAEAEWEKAGYSKAGKMEDALNEVMYQDYTWMDKAQVKLDGVTYKFEDYGIDLPESNGGYLAEMDFYSIGSNTLASIATAYDQPLYFSHPEAGSDAEDIVAGVSSFKQTDLYDYALRYTQAFEYAIHSDDFVFRNGTHKQLSSSRGSYSDSIGWTNTMFETEYKDDEHNGKHYSELFDMDSLVTNFLFVEYAMNWDSMKNSFFYYKDVNELAKIGPQWDFDWCWGNINMFNIYTNEPTSWHTTIEYFTREQAYQSCNWNRSLIKDPYFLVKAYEKYQDIRPIIEEMVKDGGTIDQYAEYLQNAGKANDVRWGYTYSTEYGGATAEGFEASVNSLKSFVKKRVNWLDEQFKSVDSLMDSLGYYKEADDIEITTEDNVVKATTANAACESIAFQVNGTYLIEAKVSDGAAVVMIPEEELISDGTTNNVVVAYEKNADGYILNQSLKPSGNFESIPKSAYVVFTYKPSADKSALETEIQDSIKEDQEAQYTEETWKEYIKALEAASNIMGNDDATQEEVDIALNNLKNAKNNLVIAEPEIPDEPVLEVDSAKLLATRLLYTGKIRIPSIIIKNTDGDQLVNKTDYTYAIYNANGVKITSPKLVGTYTIRVTYIGAYEGTEQTKLTYTIVPKAATNVKARLVPTTGYNKVKVSWTKSIGATGYYVYYKKSTANSYTKYKRVTGSYATISNLASGTTYSFKVIPYYGTEKIKSTKSTVVTATTLKKISGVKVTRTGKKAKVSWTNIKGESGYQISRSTKKTGTANIKTYSGASLKTKTITLSKSKKYYYKVRAYKNVVVDGKTKKVYGPWSSVVYK